MKMMMKMKMIWHLRYPRPLLKHPPAFSLAKYIYHLQTSTPIIINDENNEEQFDESRKKTILIK